MAVKREFNDFESDIDVPSKKAKTGKSSPQNPPKKSWTVEDGKLIKKLKEEDKLDWKFLRPSQNIIVNLTDKLRNTSLVCKPVLSVFHTTED